MRRLRRLQLVAAALATTSVLAGCGTTASAAAPVPVMPTVSASATSSAVPRPTPSSAAPEPTRTPIALRLAAERVDAMTPAQRAGAVVMTAQTVDRLPSLAATVRRYHLGGVMVRGRSAAGAAAVARAVAAAIGTASPRPLVATDQEGGEVQVLSGRGIPAIPSALRQGTLTASTLERRAKAWGGALRAAGVDLDLAPVGDVPCPAHVADDPPIAAFDRQFSNDPARAASSLAAFVTGMTAAGVATTVKHFPGLGCVGANTDVSADVVDTSTTLRSPLLRPFAAGIASGTPVVMVSSAIYARIDHREPALFSKTVIHGLRTRFAFGGVVMSDDVGGAVALQRWAPAVRATRFIGAGGDLLLDIDPEHVPAETHALVAAASSSRAFAARLRAAAVADVALRLSLDAG